jgi:hypothetical protein
MNCPRCENPLKLYSIIAWYKCCGIAADRFSTGTEYKFICGKYEVYIIRFDNRRNKTYIYRKDLRIVVFDMELPFDITEERIDKFFVLI